MISNYSILSFFIIFVGYILQTSFLQFYFYYIRKSDINIWKIQPLKSKTTGTFWGFPILSNKPNRGPYHRYLTCWNLFIASCVACITTEYSINQWNKMRFENLSFDSITFLQLIFEVIVIVNHECIIEYYWHRLMHLSFFYKNFHKMHHYYKSPEPWDDMYIHPFEAFGYYCILYSPPFVYSIHWYSFIVYMIIMGILGVLDHSGVIISIPGLYITIDHDLHHSKFELNYSFPFPYMDILHGTYEGEFLGRKYTLREAIKCNED